MKTHKHQSNIPEDRDRRQICWQDQVENLTSRGGDNRSFSSVVNYNTAERIAKG
jgi:hypothetical protein